MANTFLKRTLSVVMCAAMLVSVFAVSFTASATTGITTDENGSTVYNWNYADTTNGADYVTETSSKGNYYNDIMLNYDTGGWAWFTGDFNKVSGLVFNAPNDKCTPSELTAVTPNNSNGEGNMGAGSVVLGYITRGTATNLCKFWIASSNYNNGAEIVYHIQDMDRRDLLNGTSTITKATAPDKFKNLLTNDGTSVGSNKYKSAFGEDVPKADIATKGKLTYTYNTQINGDTVTLNATITYKKDDNTTYTTSIVPIKIGLSDLQALDPDITGFTPALGIGRDCWGSNYNSQFYSLNVKFTSDGCEHLTQKTENAKEATCTEAGYTGDTVCSNCGKTLEKGSTIAALGHEHAETDEGTATAPTCTEKGYTIYKCTRCENNYKTDYADALGHNYVTIDEGTEAAGCIKQGTQAYKCNRDGCEATKAETVAATGHTWGAWTVETAAAETTDGSMTRTCSACSTTETRIIPRTAYTTYDWDFTDKTTADDATTSNGAAAVTDLKGNSTFTPSDKVSYNQNGYAEISADSSAITAAFNTPNGCTPYKLTVESLTDTDGNNVGAGAVVIGHMSGTQYQNNVTVTNQTVQAWVTAVKSNGIATATLRIQRQGREKPLVNESLTIAVDGGTKSTDYNTVFGADVFNNLNNLKYKYEVTVEDDTAILNITVTYTDTSTGNVYTAYADPININSEYLNTKAGGNYNNIEFAPDCFGIARDQWGSWNKYTSKFYSVQAVYTPVKVKVDSARVILNDGINLTINTTSAGIASGTEAVLTVDGEKVELNNGSAVITKYAHQMTDKMNITLTARGVDGETHTYTVKGGSYSIADNLESIYNSGTTSDNDKTLIAKLANYGAAAQKYYNLSHSGYYTAFANDFLDDTNKTTSEEAYKIFTNTASGSFINTGTTHFAASFNVGLALSLQDNVKMVAKISGIALGDNEKLYIKMDGVETELVNNGNDEYTAVFGEFPPKDYAADKIITLVVKSDGSEDEVSNEATYSVGAYINRMARKDTTSEELKTLLNTLAEYYGAAIAE